MIHSDVQLDSTRLALAKLETAMADLHKQKGKMHPDRYRMQSEPIIDEIQRLRGEIDEYVGVTEAFRDLNGNPHSDPATSPTAR
ncbi:MAG TPA: hypothetical protein VKS79_01090 [Gemmataceae bacterium]|nr:hypothetical protein [Gemmataceae bacterium]